jgi:hypothetical protein
MSLRLLLPMTVLAVLTSAVFSSSLRAEDGDGQPTESYSYVVPQRRVQPPNSTYWTKMQCPLFGGCCTCGNAYCNGGRSFWTFPSVRWTLDPNYYAVAPDHGWDVPGKWPVKRQYVTYTQYRPKEWYGAGTPGKSQQVKSYPVIGQPTDTAQMGYYYQQVPTWQPRPNMIPPKPDPRQWHWRQYQQQSGMNRSWVKVNGVWVPSHQAPGKPVENAAPVPEPMPEAAPPVPVPPANGPRALYEPIDGAIRRAGL